MKESTWDYETFQKKAHLGALDGMRAISILLVIWHHTPRAGWTHPVLTHGFLGVDIFFVISGFLIVTLLLRERDKTGEIALKNFYARRILRISPVYYLVLAITSFVLFFVVPQATMTDPFFAELPYYVSYTSNWVHSATLLSITWSLATEEQFYLVWPPIERVLSRWAVPILLVVILINQMINFQFPQTVYRALISPQIEALEIVQITFTPICLGVLMAHILHDGKGYKLAQNALGKWIVPFLLIAGMIAAVSLPGKEIGGLPRLAVHVFSALLIGSLVLLRSHPLITLLSQPLMMRIGIISYGMYLYHLFARHASEVILQQLGLEGWYWLFFVTVLVTILISEISYRYYEMPFLKLKKYFKSNQPNQDRVS